MDNLMCPRSWVSAWVRSQPEHICGTRRAMHGLLSGSAEPRVCAVAVQLLSGAQSVAKFRCTQTRSFSQSFFEFW
eukprot:3468521-Rhodomonas_salina.1